MIEEKNVIIGETFGSCDFLDDVSSILAVVILEQAGVDSNDDVAMNDYFNYITGETSKAHFIKRLKKHCRE